jgi:hypothetical protein
MRPAGFIVHEVFQFDGKWYGILHNDYDGDFKRYIEIIKFYPGGCDWKILDGVTNEAIKYFHEKDSNDDIKNERNI